MLSKVAAVVVLNSSHLALMLSHISVAFALMVSQFLYRSTPIAITAAMTAITIPTGEAKEPNTPIKDPTPDTIFPITTRIGPIAAAMAIAFTIMFCVSGESEFHISEILANPSVIF